MTTDPRDELLRELGARARQDAAAEAEAVDSKWSRLTLGTATEEEKAALREQAESDPEAARLEQAFRPTDEDFRRRLSAAALRRIDEARQEVAPSESTSEESPSSKELPPPIGGADWFRSPVSRSVALAAGLLLAVGLLLSGRGPSAEGDFGAWSLATERQRSTSRPSPSQAAETVELRSGETFFLDLEIAPDVDAAGISIPGHRASLFLRDAKGRLHTLTVEHEARSAGRLEVRAKVEPGVAAGEATLVVALHSDRRVDVEQVRGSLRGRSLDWLYGSWQRFERRVRIVAIDAKLEVSYEGCSAVRAPPNDPICELHTTGPSTLRLWVATGDPDTLTVETASRRLTLADAEPAHGGYVFRLQDLVPETESMIEIGAGTSPREVRRLRLELVDVAGAHDGEQRRRVADFSERVNSAFRAGRTEELVELLETKAGLQGDLGLVSAQILDLAFLFHVRFELRGDLAAASRTLDRLPDLPWGDGRSAYLAHFSRGTLALETGDLGQALLHLGQAARHSERSGRLAERNMAEQQSMRILRRLGRGLDANSIRERLAAEVHLLRDCDQPSLMNNLAWDRLQVLEARRAAGWLGGPGSSEEELGQAAELFRQALAALGRCDRPADGERINLHINLALTHLHQADARGAEAQLASIAPDDPALTPRLRVWKLDLEARLALLEGHPERALILARDLAEAARQGQGADAGWRAAWLEARASEALGDRATALAAHDRAEGWLDDASRRVPLDADRVSALAVRGASTAAYLRLLLEAGEVERAFRVARHARVRLYRGVVWGAAPGLLATAELEAWVAAVRRYGSAADSSLGGEVRSSSAEARRLEELRAAWSATALAAEPLDRRLEPLGLGAEEPLPGLDPRELVLLFHPLGNRSWAGFGARGGEIVSHVFEALDPAMTTDILAPFVGLMPGARQVRVLPYGALAGLDFHALLLDGAPLFETLPVVYGLDLPSAPETGIRGEQRALLIADPRGDLPSVAAELDSVRRSLRAWQFPTPEVASAPAVIGMLDEVDLLHFAGHADFAGRDGLDSHLALAIGDRLSAADLLSSEVRAPKLVVLSACTAARSELDAFSPGLGLAHAFLLRGSRLVLGATEPVGDRSTRRFMEHFYGAWDGTIEGASKALQRAQSLTWAATRGTGDEGVWRAFRLLTR